MLLIFSRLTANVGCFQTYKIAELDGHGTTTFDACSFLQWGGHAMQANVSAMTQRGGNLILTSNEFMQPTRHLDILSGARKTLVTSNIFAGALDIKSSAGPAVTNTTACDAVPAVCRVLNCGFSGITPAQCAARGCCFDNHNPATWCYIKACPHKQVIELNLDDSPPLLDTTRAAVVQQRVTEAGGVRQWLIELRQMVRDGLVSAEEETQARRAALGLKNDDWPITSNSHDNLAGFPTGAHRWGVNVHFNWRMCCRNACANHSSCDMHAGAEAKMLAPAFGSARMDMSWSHVEQTRGVYDWESSGYAAFVSQLLAANPPVMPYFILSYGNQLYDNACPAADKHDGTCPPTTDAGRQAFANFTIAAMRRFQVTKDSSAFVFAWQGGFGSLSPFSPVGQAILQLSAVFFCRATAYSGSCGKFVHGWTDGQKFLFWFFITSLYWANSKTASTKHGVHALHAAQERTQWRHMASAHFSAGWGLRKTGARGWGRTGSCRPPG